MIEYANSDGETEHAAQTFGEVRIVEALGLLEVGKSLIWEDEEEGEDT